MHLESMTGFGEHAYEATAVTCIAEIRSYNSRTLDIIVRGDSIPPELELRLRGLIRKKLFRGRIEISFMWHYTQKGIIALTNAHAQTHFQYKKALSHSISDDALSARLLRSELYASASSFHRRARIEAALKAFQKALVKVTDSRMSEGKLLTKELWKIFKRLCSHYGHIKNTVDESSRAGKGPEKKTESKQDVAEELARIEVHLESLESSLKAKGHQGKKIEFILQELLREFTTTGSKIGKSSISKAVTLGKLEIERLREQVQNIV